MMWNARNRTRRAPRRRMNAHRTIPLLDGVEPRILLSADGFLQGTVFVDATGSHQFNPLAGNTPQAGAIVELIQNNAVLETQTTGADGSYLFTGLAAGTYQLTEIPPSGYAGDGTQINSPLNPATAPTPSTITAQVEDLSSLSYQYNDVYEYASLEPGVVQFQVSTDGGSTYTTQLLTIGQMPVTVTYPTGATTQATTPEFTSYCVQPDSTLNYGVDTVGAYASPLGSTLVPSTNAGAIGYLYEQYGSLLAQPPSSLSEAYDLQALQLAIWKLEYDTGSDLTTFSGGNLKDLSIDTQYNNYQSVENDPSLTDLEGRAFQYIQEGLQYSAPAIELVATSGTNGTQNILAPEILNFGNVPGNVATSVAHAAGGQPISGPVAVGTSVYDTSTVTPSQGGPTPSGTVTYNVYNTSSPIYGVTTPIATDTETLTTAGAVPNSAPFQPQAPGSYAYIAVYSGDGNYGISVGQPETFPVNQAAPTITTQASETGNVVGSATLIDTAALSGGYQPGGTITFALTGPDGKPVSLPPADASVTVSGDGSYTTPTPVTATEVGSYVWTATYSGDANNSPASEPATSTEVANETVNTVQASPTISTTPNVVNVALGTGSVVLKDTATLSGAYDPTGTITFTLYAPDGRTVLDTETMSVAGDGSYTTPTGYTLPSDSTIGVYQWDATYSGDADNTAASDLNDPSEQVTVVASSPVAAGDFATIGFWHNKNGQAVIESFNGGASSTQLGNWLATSFPNLFGGKNAYLPSSLAGMTNAQVARAYEKLWNPGGLDKNTFVQAFAVALGIYADSPSLGYDATAAGFGFNEVNIGGSSLTFNVGSNGSALGVPNTTSLTVFRILELADSNFNAATGTFFGGDSTKTGALNNLLDGINTTGDI